MAWPSSSFGILGGAVRVMGEVGADLTGFRHLALLPPRGEAARRPAVADRLTVLRWPGELTRFRDLARPAGRWWWVVVKADAFTYSSRSAAGGSPLS